MILSGIVLDGKEFHLLESIGFFSMAIAGAAAIGVVFGLAGSVLLRSWHAFSDHFIAPLLPILFIYLAFAMAQAGFEISGVIAVMAATITFRVIYIHLHRDESPSEKERERYLGLWDFMAGLANVLLFFVLGVEMGIRIQIGGLPHWAVPAGIAALIIARVAVIYGFGLLTRSTRMRVELPWLHVMNIGGLRGALSVALVLMIPLDYHYRDVFLYMALSMSLFSLIVNPLVMRIYLKKADLSEK
jgi:CPA1 family monovalent cation:H+ antiporter